VLRSCCNAIWPLRSLGLPVALGVIGAALAPAACDHVV
jgi:hypothetical protein